MTELKPYPEYEDSGVAWLGDVPKHWSVRSVKSLFSERKLKSRPEDTHLTPSQTHGVLPQTEYMERTGNRVVLNLTGSDAMRHVEPDDFISHLRSFQGGFEHSRLVGKVSAAYTVLEPLDGVTPAYFRYLFKSSMYIQALQTTTDQLRDGQSIRFAQVVLLPLPSPQPPEQQTIADFLDRETAEIDAFIADQEELIALLAERRAATISHAVTKGLDPTVPMKDSGVEWLGEVPEHWRRNKASRLFKARKGSEAALLTKEFIGDHPGTFPVYSGQTENDGVMGMFERFEFDSGSIGYLLISTVGAKAMSLHHVFGKFSLSQNCMVVGPLDSQTVLRFYFYFFHPLFAFERGRIPEHMQASFRMEDLYQYLLAVPPIQEQRNIADYLDRETAELDATIADAREAIALSKERRAALISAAVTGKIDVRGESDTQL